MSNWSPNDFLLFCILSGCDYCQFETIGCAKAYKLVQKVLEDGAIAALQLLGSTFEQWLAHVVRVLKQHSPVLAKLDDLRDTLQNSFRVFRSAYVIDPITLEQRRIACDWDEGATNIAGVPLLQDLVSTYIAGSLNPHTLEIHLLAADLDKDVPAKYVRRWEFRPDVLEARLPVFDEEYLEKHFPAKNYIRGFRRAVQRETWLPLGLSEDNDNCYLRCLVPRSMFLASYTVYVHLRINIETRTVCEIVDIHCACPQGALSACTHGAVAIHTAQDICRSAQRVENEQSSLISCTSLARKWGVHVTSGKLSADVLKPIEHFFILKNTSSTSKKSKKRALDSESGGSAQECKQRKREPGLHINKIYEEPSKLPV
eukprot:Colp12_sorted_trinity150504_noHs@2681